LNSLIFAEVLNLEAITADTLRNEKGYAKATKKQQKELETMRKKHSKERLLVQKGQCVSIEKLVKGKQ
jgi:phosphatidylinositol phospholipase C beta